jgi:hypothetical protein
MNAQKVTAYLKYCQLTLQKYKQNFGIRQIWRMINPVFTLACLCEVEASCSPKCPFVSPEGRAYARAARHEVQDAR